MGMRRECAESPGAATMITDDLQTFGFLSSLRRDDRRARGAHPHLVPKTAVVRRATVRQPEVFRSSEGKTKSFSTLHFEYCTKLGFLHSSIVLFPGTILYSELLPVSIFMGIV